MSTERRPSSHSAAATSAVGAARGSTAWFGAICLPVADRYGPTGSCATTVFNRLDDPEYGTVGRPGQDLERQVCGVAGGRGPFGVT